MMHVLGTRGSTKQGATCGHRGRSGWALFNRNSDSVGRLTARQSETLHKKCRTEQTCDDGTTQCHKLVTNFPGRSAGLLTRWKVLT